MVLLKLVGSVIDFMEAETLKNVKYPQDVNINP